MGPGGQRYCGLAEAVNEVEVVQVAQTLGTVMHGRIPVRVRNLNPFPVQLYWHQKLATISPIDPMEVQGERALTLTELSPSVVEAGVKTLNQQDATGEGFLCRARD